MRLVLAVWVILAASLPVYAGAANRDLERIPSNLVFLFVVAIALVVMGNKTMVMGSDRRLRAATSRARTTPSPPAPAASWGTKSSWLIRSASPATPGTR